MSEEFKHFFESAKSASVELNLLNEQKINEILLFLAKLTEENADFILEENKKDLARMDEKNPVYDRLKLTPERIAGIVADMRNVASLPSPLGIVLEEKTLPNELKLRKITVPFGVIGAIFEARPNVCFDIFSLCLKSGNACVLKGGTDADFSNQAIVKIIKNGLEKMGVNPNFVTLLPAGRVSTAELLGAVGYVDVIIPRGSAGLIAFVRDNAKIPVIETGAGVCHTYFDFSGDLEKGSAIIFNAKTRRVSVCNALDCLIINEKRLADLPKLCEKLATKNVEIFADEKAFAALNGFYPSELLEKADEHSFGTEFMDYKMAVKTVADTDEAIAHIARFSSKHSEAIVSENADEIAKFEKIVDAACVYSNAPTSFTDGAQFGLGAEIGISTQKLHARGPMALREITSYKWLIRGNGQVRP